MKNLRNALLSFAALLFAGAASADLVTYTQADTITVDSSGADFSFNKFNTSEGTLTGITLTVSGHDTGSFTVTNTGTKTMKVNSATDSLTVIDNAEPGVPPPSYNTATFTLGQSPSVPYNVAAGASPTFTLTGTNNFTPYTDTFASSRFDSYMGLGTVSFNVANNASVNTSGSAGSFDMGNVLADTTLTLIYTYNNLTAVPEAGQVAASALVLFALGGVLIHRRKIAKPAQ